MNQQLLHDEWEENILARAAGEPNNEGSALFDEHLVSCSSCEQEVREYEFLARRLRSLEQDIAVPALSPALLALQQEIVHHHIQEEAHQIVEQAFAQESKKSARVEPPESELVELAQFRDTEAFAELYSRHVNGVYRYLLGFIRDREDAHDLVQETFFKCWQHLQTLRDPSCFKPWLYNIARKVSIDYMRQKKRVVTTVSFLPDEKLQTDVETQSALVVSDQEEQVLEEIMVIESCRVAFRQIPYQMQLVLSLHIWGGFSYREIASVLGMSEMRVTLYGSRGRKALRQAFKALESSP